jgi:hypothetical protein
MTIIITWQQELSNISDPLEAAKQCLKDIQNGESLIFTVKNETTNQTFSVDLGEPDEDAVIEIK